MFGRRKTKAAPAAEEAAPGWDAIEACVRERVPTLGTEEPVHWGSSVLPGQDGLYGISAYPDGDLWLFVTFGLSELFAKESDDLATSGWGIEITMRVPRTSDSPPPVWPVSALEQLGMYVYSTASPFAPGHRVSTGLLPNVGDHDPLTAIAFAEDPQLGDIDTPNGRLTFLTAVGVTSAELELMKSTTTAEVLAELQRVSPLLVTGTHR